MVLWTLVRNGMALFDASQEDMLVMRLTLENAAILGFGWVAEYYMTGQHRASRAARNRRHDR